MNYAGIKYFDIANAPGVGVSLFVSGCPHHCEGCFNSEAWDYNFGEPYTYEVTSSIVEFCKEHPQIESFSLLGGEPLAQSIEDDEMIVDLIIRLAKETNVSHYWIWSGYTFEEIKSDSKKWNLVHYFDVLVDGKFELDKKDLRLAHRGSANQRVIDVAKSICENKIVLWSDNT